MSARLMSCLGVTGTPFSDRMPLAGRVSMRTAARVSPTSGSVKPKSAAVRVIGVSSVPVSFLSVPAGGSFTGLTLSVSVAVDEAVPSLTV